MMSLLESKRNDGTQKEFWNIFRKISPRTKKGIIQPSMKKFFDHFQNLSNSSRAQNFPSLSSVSGPHDYEIVLEELEECCKKLRYGKSNSYEDSCNEMLISLCRTYSKVLLTLFNKILESR